MSSIESENKIMTMLALRHSEKTAIHAIARNIIDTLDNKRLVELRQELRQALTDQTLMERI